jgi:hypothetical protein
VPADAFDHFKAELATLKGILSATSTKTLRDDLLLERFRTLVRTWVSVVRPEVDRFLQSKKEFFKLGAEIENLAALTSKFKSVLEYRKRVNRAISLANNLVLFIPSDNSQHHPFRAGGREDLFTSGIPDLPVRLVPNGLLGWKRQMEAFLTDHPYDKSVFVMIRYRKRNGELISRVKSVLSKSGYIAILAKDHTLTDDLYNAVACLLCCSKGLAIFDRPESGQVFNPNVAYELGMMHLLGRQCGILKHANLRVLHTDILMKLYIEYHSVEDAGTHVSHWLNGSP